ncbi:MAG: SAM hydrolase/SAM-dependent halogenase family protein [Desulfovibrionales bacterium]
MRDIVLLTDFGLSDPYVGQMKGVLAALAPKTRVLDLTHGVMPHNVLQAAFFLTASWPWFRPGSLFLAVVDPGVGTNRGFVLLETHDRLFLAPDNGLLSLLLAETFTSLWVLETAPFRRTSSQTFHGRDIFAPLAAKLSSGIAPESLGRPAGAEEVICCAWREPDARQDSVLCTVLHVDRFGNIVLNLREDLWWNTLCSRTALALGPERTILHPVRTYAEIPAGKLGILRGSQGFLEVAADRDNASRRVRAESGTPLLLQWSK